MNQQRNYPRLLLYSVLLFAAAACMVFLHAESSNKSVIRGNNLRRMQVRSRNLRSQARYLSSSTDEEEDTDLDSDSGDESDEEETQTEEDSDSGEAEEEAVTKDAEDGADGADAGGVDADGQDDSDSDEGDEDSDSDEDEVPEDPEVEEPADSASPFGQKEEPAAPTKGFPADPNSPATQFGDTPFLGGQNDWTTTTPPIEDVESWITPIEPTDEEPTYATPTENAGIQGDALNPPGFPSGGNGIATPANGQYGLHGTTSSSFSPPSEQQGGGFNTQYGNSQFNGVNGGQSQKKGGGGLVGAWKNMKDKSVEQGKSSLGEEIKEEEELEEEEEADETEGITDDDNLSSVPREESGNKPPDADDEFEKMIEDAEGKTSKEKGTSKETTEDTFDDLDAEEKEEIAEEELQEVEEELKEEEEVAAAAGGMGFLLAIGGMIFTAHQMSENPDGVYASVCRLAITISGVIVKIICMPCRKIIGTGNPHYGTHMRISTSADYGMGGANAGFEMS